MVDLPPGAEVTYEFHDSSVPPPYHRSYVLIFDRTSARIVVDSYGDILADRTAAIPDDVWVQVAQSYPDVVGLDISQPEQGCTGGTAFALTVAGAGTADIVLHGSQCGGVNSAAAHQLAGWVAPVRSLFPPMDELAPEGD
jgi:hypothetical protein